MLAASRLNSAVVSAGIGVELSVITATVLGGASLKGGEGSILGGVLGVLFIALVQNAMIINGIGIFWQNIIVGLRAAAGRVARPLQAELASVIGDVAGRLRRCSNWAMNSEPSFAAPRTRRSVKRSQSKRSRHKTDQGGRQ